MFLPWRRTSVDDLPLVDRLLKFYRSTYSDSHYSGQWRVFFRSRHLGMHETFMHGSTEEAASLLRDPASNDLQFGFDNVSKTVIEQIKKDEAGTINYCRRTMHNLALALGAKLGNPEFGTNQTCSLSDVEKTIGRIDFPNPFRGEIGLQTNRGIASARALYGIYQGWRVKRLARGPVVEVGAGLGRGAYYAHLFGVRDYTIIDLPFTSMSSGYFLGRLLGEAVSFHGEPKRDIHISVPEAFPKSFDFSLNVDSLTEMSIDAAKNYANLFNLGRLFLSINHEANAFTVRSLMGEPLIRGPYWLREGYVEELFTGNQA